jgi:hypothetical protein
VNPGFVPGPALDAEIGTSLQALAMAPVAGGRRLISAGETWMMSRMAREMHAVHSDRARKIPVGVLSAGMVRMLSLADASVRTLQAGLGVSPTGDSACTATLTGVAFTTAAEAVSSASRALIEPGLA